VSGLSCDRCGRRGPVEPHLTSITGGLLCDGCLAELTVFRGTEVDALLAYGGHLTRTVTFRRPRFVEVYNKQTKQWEARRT
jgi:hypothetical protein